MGHLDFIKGFLGEGQQEKLQGLIDQGYKTAQEFMAEDGETASIIEHLRQPPGGGPPTSLGDRRVIMVRFGQRGVQEDDRYGPIRLSRTTGIMQHEVGEFDLQIDDIVMFKGRACRVTAIYPQEFDVVTSELELIQ